MKCPICYVDDSEEISQLVCKHIYHKTCINSWLNINNTCPICREVVVSPKPSIVENIIHMALSSDQVLSFIFSTFIDETVILELFRLKKLTSHDVSLLISLGYVTDEWIISDLSEHFAYS